jgi:flavin reductase (DIM6/NTAB) family NADH-FMN oxidoreductase RutF
MKETTMSLEEVDFTHELDLTLIRMQEQGLLLTSADPEGTPNIMTIGWGNPGVTWGRPVFVVLVRPSRFTFGNIEATGEFVVNVPTPQMAEACEHCGTVSGRDHQKFRECGLTPRIGRHVEVPLIEECVLHYECRVLQRNDVIESQLDDQVHREFYGAGDFHRVYFGEVVQTLARV